MGSKKLSNPQIRTEFQFTLPKGLVDENGTLHKEGVMRLATAADEILPLKDPRVQQNPAYLTVIILSRVITKLGDLEVVTAKTIEDLFASDLAYLQSFYDQINSPSNVKATAICPNCKTEFTV